MPLFVKFRSFLRNFFLSHRVEVDLEQEVRSHLEMLVEENIRPARIAIRIASGLQDQTWRENMDESVDQKDAVRVQDHLT
jgi:hypothetical protein